ncbi:hypothetical protein HDU96_007809 [Phlyctochytrium bullatum]|nr:hypothetical protein HDU96_007809 [Phlyctochytrium bullatum]
MSASDDARNASPSTSRQTACIRLGQNTARSTPRGSRATPVVTSAPAFWFSTRGTCFYGLRLRRTSPREVRLMVLGDSELVVKQMMGEWKVAEPTLKMLHAICDGPGGEENKEADALAAAGTARSPLMLEACVFYLNRRSVGRWGGGGRGGVQGISVLPSLAMTLQVNAGGKKVRVVVRNLLVVLGLPVPMQLSLWRDPQFGE